MVGAEAALTRLVRRGELQGPACYGKQYGLAYFGLSLLFYGELVNKAMLTRSALQRHSSATIASHLNIKSDRDIS